jgi:cytochrome c oxidase subunit IV
MDFPIPASLYCKIILIIKDNMHSENNNPMNMDDSVEIPNPSTDYHGHPNYSKILKNLFLLFGFSLIAGYLFSPIITIVLIFATAIWKCILVVKNFMHLQFEPLLIWIAVAAVLFCLLAFFFGVYPDITAAELDVTPR